MILFNKWVDHLNNVSIDDLLQAYNKDGRDATFPNNGHLVFHTFANSVEISYKGKLIADLSVWVEEDEGLTFDYDKKLSEAIDNTAFMEFIRIIGL